MSSVTLDNYPPKGVSNFLEKRFAEIAVRKRELRIVDVQELLRERCAAAGGQRAFAATHGFQVQYVSQVLHGQRPPSERLCQTLGIQPDGLRWVK